MTLVILGDILTGFSNDIFLSKSHTSKNNVSAVLHNPEILIDSQATEQST